MKSIRGNTIKTKGSNEIQGASDASKSIESKEELVNKLVDSGANCDPDAIVCIARDYKNEINWIEKGNSKAGLEHILDHYKDFKSMLGIEKNDIADYVIDTVKSRVPVDARLKSIPGGRSGWQLIFQTKDSDVFLVVGKGTNGFIVSAYPTTKAEAMRKIRRTKNNEKDKKY